MARKYTEKSHENIQDKIVNTQINNDPTITESLNYSTQNDSSDENWKDIPNITGQTQESQSKSEQESESIIEFENFRNEITQQPEKYKTQTDKNEEQKVNFREAIMIVDEHARMNEIHRNSSFVIIAELYQKGSHLKNVSNRAIYFNGLQYTKQGITQAMTRKNSKLTHRTMARALREIILLSSQMRNIAGHLFPQYKKHLIINGISLDPETLSQHSYYCTDFQIDNNKLPMEVAKFLANRTRNKK